MWRFGTLSVDSIIHECVCNIIKYLNNNNIKTEMKLMAF